MVEPNKAMLSDHRPERVNRTRSAFEKGCDDAWRRNWLHCYELSREIQSRADELAEGTRTNIYVIRDTSTDAVKIGLGVNPKIRLNSLQIASSTDLELVDWAPGCLPLERFLHRTLSAYKLRGEWFAPADPVLVVCELLMSAADLRRTMEDNGDEVGYAEDTIAMLCGPADFMQDMAFQLSLDVAA